METVNFIICGLGGQGILFVSRVLAQAAVDMGLDVLGGETHGMAQRGGSVVSHLRIGQAQSSLVRTGTAHFLLSLEENEGYRNLPFLAPGASFYVNTHSQSFPREEVKDYLEGREIRYRSVPAGEIAQELGASMASNLALLGYFSAFREGPVDHDKLRDTIGEISPEALKEINLRVFDAGLIKGTEEKGM